MASSEELQREIATNFVKHLDALHAEYGNHERMQRVDTAAIFYRNMYSMLTGALLSQVGYKRAFEIMNDLVAKENRFNRETKTVIIADGWLQP